MTAVNFEKHIYEGWTVGDFIDELEPLMDMIQNGNSYIKPMHTKAEIKKYTSENQPYYKKPIPDVVEYFCNKYGI